MNLFSQTWFMEGFWHPPQTPAQLILLVALGVLIGQQRRTGSLTIIISFVSSLCIGFVINHFYMPTWDQELILLVVALNVSLLIALRWKLSFWILGLLAVLSGLALGLDSRPILIPGLGNSVMYNWLAGVLVSMVLMYLFCSVLGYLLRNLINGVVLRVIGSWIATSALFVLTLMLVKH